jgi:hypothetical protein
MKYLSDYVKQEQSELFKKCGVFFAFNEEQFNEGCDEVGASKENKVTDLGSGTFCLSKNVDTFLQEIENIRKRGIQKDIEENGITNIILRELANYETQLHGDISETVEALDGYGITKEQVLEIYKKNYESDDFF